MKSPNLENAGETGFLVGNTLTKEPRPKNARKPCKTEKKSKIWSCTVFPQNESQDIKQLLKNLRKFLSSEVCKGNIKKVIINPEQGNNTHRDHLQCHIEFSFEKRFSTFINMLKKGGFDKLHIEITNNPEASISYCQKDDTKINDINPCFIGYNESDKSKYILMMEFIHREYDRNFQKSLEQYTINIWNMSEKWRSILYKKRNYEIKPYNGILWEDCWKNLFDFIDYQNYENDILEDIYTFFNCDCDKNKYHAFREKLYKNKWF